MKTPAPATYMAAENVPFKEDHLTRDEVTKTQSVRISKVLFKVRKMPENTENTCSSTVNGVLAFAQLMYRSQENGATPGTQKTLDCLFREPGAQPGPLSILLGVSVASLT